MLIFNDKLWALLTDKEINQDVSVVSFNVLAKMGKNEFVSTESLHKFALRSSAMLGTS